MLFLITFLYAHEEIEMFFLNPSTLMQMFPGPLVNTSLISPVSLYYQYYILFIFKDFSLYYDNLSSYKHYWSLHYNLEILFLLLSLSSCSESE